MTYGSCEERRVSARRQNCTASRAWLIHCHILHHTTNHNVEEQGGGGLTMVINVTS